MVTVRGRLRTAKLTSRSARKAYPQAKAKADSPRVSQTPAPNSFLSERPGRRQLSPQGEQQRLQHSKKEDCDHQDNFPGSPVGANLDRFDGRGQKKSGARPGPGPPAEKLRLSQTLV